MLLPKRLPPLSFSCTYTIRVEFPRLIDFLLVLFKLGKASIAHHSIANILSDQFKGSTTPKTVSSNGSKRSSVTVELSRGYNLSK